MVYYGKEITSELRFLREQPPFKEAVLNKTKHRDNFKDTRPYSGGPAMISCASFCNSSEPLIFAASKYCSSRFRGLKLLTV